jgi:hypothetical protein
LTTEAVKTISLAEKERANQPMRSRSRSHG